MSVCRLGHDVSVRPRSDAGLDQRPRRVADRGDRLAGCDEARARTRRRPRRSAGRPGWPRRRAAPARRSRRRRPSATVASTSKVSALSRWLNACTLPVSGDSSTGVPPASSTAFHGSVSSTCSMPSVATRKATLAPAAGVGGGAGVESCWSWWCPSGSETNGARGTVAVPTHDNQTPTHARSPHAWRKGSKVRTGSVPGAWPCTALPPWSSCRSARPPTTRRGRAWVGVWLSHVAPHGALAIRRTERTPP